MNVTQWFDEKVKPVHVGVYESGTRAYHDPTVIVAGTFQHWNGKFWGIVCGSPQDAAAHTDTKSEFQNEPWRGIVRGRGRPRKSA